MGCLNQNSAKHRFLGTWRFFLKLILNRALDTFTHFNSDIDQRTHKDGKRKHGWPKNNWQSTYKEDLKKKWKSSGAIPFEESCCPTRFWTREGLKIEWWKDRFDINIPFILDVKEIMKEWQNNSIFTPWERNAIKARFCEN